MCEMADGSLEPPVAPTFWAKALADGVVLRNLRGERPGQHVFLLDDRAAAVAMDGNRLGKAGVNARGGEDHAEGAAGEAEAADRRILNLDALMGQQASEAAHVGGRAHHPE